MPEGQEGEQLGFRRFLGSPLTRKQKIDIVVYHRNMFRIIT